MSPIPRGGNFGVKKYKIDVILEKSSSLLPGIDQTKQVCSNDDQGRMYQNCKIHASHYSEYVLSSSLSIYFTLIAIVLKDNDAAFLYNC